MNYPVPLTRAQQLAALRHVTAMLLSTGPGGKIESSAGYAAIATEARAVLSACDQTEYIDKVAELPVEPTSLIHEWVVTACWVVVASGVLFAAYQILRSFWVAA